MDQAIFVHAVAFGSDVKVTVSTGFRSQLSPIRLYPRLPTSVPPQTYSRLLRFGSELFRTLVQTEPWSSSGSMGPNLAEQSVVVYKLDLKKNWWNRSEPGRTPNQKVRVAQRKYQKPAIDIDVAHGDYVIRCRHLGSSAYIRIFWCSDRGP